MGGKSKTWRVSTPVASSSSEPHSSQIVGGAWVTMWSGRSLLEGMPLMPLLASCRVRARGAQRLRLGFAITLRGGRPAGVAAVLCQTPFQFGNLRRQLLNSRKQRSDQIVFLGNAESVKVRQGFHARLYRITQPFLIAGKAIFFLAT